MLAVIVDGCLTEIFEADKDLSGLERRQYIEAYSQFHQISPIGVKIKKVGK